MVWTRPLLDLTKFAGQSVRIAFHFQSNDDDNVGRGWYVDDVVVETGPSDLDTLNQAEGFEFGLGNWSVDNGTWDTGVPRSGPGLAFKGANCAATVVGFSFGNYGPTTDSRLVSPEFTVPVPTRVRACGSPNGTTLRPAISAQSKFAHPGRTGSRSSAPGQRREPGLDHRLRSTCRLCRPARADRFSLSIQR